MNTAPTNADMAIDANISTPKPANRNKSSISYCAFVALILESIETESSNILKTKIVL